jgi:hypothetical protein
MIWNNHHQITKLVVKNYEGGRNFFTPMAHVGLETAPSHHDGLSLLTTFSCSF